MFFDPFNERDARAHAAKFARAVTLTQEGFIGNNNRLFPARIEFTTSIWAASSMFADGPQPLFNALVSHHALLAIEIHTVNTYCQACLQTYDRILLALSSLPNPRPYNDQLAALILFLIRGLLQRSLMDRRYAEFASIGSLMFKHRSNRPLFIHATYDLRFLRLRFGPQHRAEHEMEQAWIRRPALPPGALASEWQTDVDVRGGIVTPYRVAREIFKLFTNNLFSKLPRTFRHPRRRPPTEY